MFYVYLYLSMRFMGINKKWSFFKGKKIRCSRNHLPNVSRWISKCPKSNERKKRYEQHSRDSHARKLIENMYSHFSAHKSLSYLLRSSYLLARVVWYSINNESYNVYSYSTNNNDGLNTYSFVLQTTATPRLIHLAQSWLSLSTGSHKSTMKFVDIPDVLISPLRSLVR